MDYDPQHYVDDASEAAVEVKKSRISLHMIVKRHLPPDASTWSHDKILDALNKLTHLRLDRENIGELDHLELLGDSVTNLYLQHNAIEQIENLDHLRGIQFLTLSHNRLRKIEGLSHLQKLAFLDLSFNFIHTLDKDEIPQSVALLNLTGNKCTQQLNYRLQIISSLPRLRQLDGEEVGLEESRAAGLEVSSDEESEDDEQEQDTRPSTQDIFSLTSSEILLRSQDRMESSLLDHRNKRLFLRDLRTSSNNIPQ